MKMERVVHALLLGRGRRMLLSLAQWLQTLYPEQLGFLRVFQYLTFRAVMAAMTALLIGLAFGPWVIRRLTDAEDRPADPRVRREGAPGQDAARRRWAAC